MSKYNKTELDNYINTYIVPVVTNAVHIDVLENFTDSAVLKERRVTTAAMTSNSYALNFANIEMYDIDCNGRDMTFTVSNLSEGEEVHVRMTDTSGGSIAFSNVTLLGNNRDNGNAPIIPLAIIYKIVNIRGTYYGYYVGYDEYLASSSFDFEDFHALTTDMKILTASAWTNGPFTPTSLYILHIRTTRSLVFNTSQYATMYELTTSCYGTTDVRKFIGKKKHTDTLSWTEIT